MNITNNITLKIIKIGSIKIIKNMENNKKNIFLDTNALIYLYKIESKNENISLNIDDISLLNEYYINYLKSNTKQLFFCSDSYYEFLCHCYKHNCEEDFEEFYSFIIDFCKKVCGNLPQIIDTPGYYSFDTKKFVKDLYNGKVDYKFYVEKRVNAEAELLKNLYIPLIETIKELLNNKFPTIQLYEEKDYKMIELIDKCIKENLYKYYNTKDSELSADMCVNVPISIVIEKYRNINYCNYSTVEQMEDKIDEFDICNCLNAFLKEVINDKTQEYKIANEDFYNIFCKFTQKCRDKNKEIVLYDYIDYIVKKILFKTDRKVKKNDIIDLSIISTIISYIDGSGDSQNNVFISFDKFLRNFIKDKKDNNSTEKNIYNKLELFDISLVK